MKTLTLKIYVQSIEEKLSSLPKNVEFDKKNSGHLALLIAEIIRISYPIILSEIEMVLMALDLDIKAIRSNASYIFT